ncbi:MAG: proteasome accessory factor PafA2 family protein [Verrucomicrobiales bacterium]|nr:proteasome accessory factor PafA2 family protein [Verrucomicrobiales bacterium]
MASDSPSVLFGIETEFGIARDTDEDYDVVAESIALVRAAAEPGVRMRWDYDCEDPHRDVRGFRVRELRQDTDEANYRAEDEARPLSFAEIKSDLVLGNGARFYNDHAHPEYCTPECSTVRELVTQDRAGERIAMACAARLGRERGERVLLYKNNTDFRGHSYGCHENYLLPRALPWDSLVRGVEAFLVTRQIFAGAGKFGIEDEDRFVGPGFQISQRADFFSVRQSVDTMQRRPLINTRDEPHANERDWRRFHVILGDANLSPFATRLKVGTTALVLEALTAGGRGRGETEWPLLEDPLSALRTISRDGTFRWEVRAEDGTATTALEIQRQYLELVRAACDPARPEVAAILADWDEVLRDLEADPERCADRLDWVAKRSLIRAFQESESLEPGDPWLRSLDLAYHSLDPEEGLYFGLEQSGAMRGVPEESEVQRAIQHPPETTRAWVRGECIRKFGDAVVSAQWDHVTLRGGSGWVKVSLMDLFAPSDVRRYRDALSRASSPDELKTLLNL